MNLKLVARDNPVIFALLVALVQVPIGLLVLTGTSWLYPQLPQEAQRIAITVLTAVLAAFLVTALGWWERIGFVGPGRWRSARLLFVPVLFALWPLLGGWRFPPAGLLIVMVLLQLVNAFAEETLMRGVVLETLRSRGTYFAIILSSVLFGSLHITRAFIDQDPVTTALQILLATLLGIGFAAVRLRTHALGPILLAHALYDLALDAGTLQDRLPAPAILGLMLATGLAFAAWGLWIVRAGTTRATSTSESTHEALYR